MKRSVRALSSLAVAGMLVGLTTTLAQADTHEATGGEKAAANGCSGKDGCNGGEAKDSCKGKDTCKSADGKDSCHSKDDCKSKEGGEAKESCHAKEAGDAKHEATH